MYRKTKYYIPIETREAFNYRDTDDYKQNTSATPSNIKGTLYCSSKNGRKIFLLAVLMPVAIMPVTFI